MADEPNSGANRSSGGNENRDGKRRYFRRRKSAGQGNETSSRPATEGKEKPAKEGQSSNGKSGESAGSGPRSRSGARRRVRRTNSGNSAANSGAPANRKTEDGASATNRKSGDGAGSTNRKSGEGSASSGSRRTRRSRREGGSSREGGSRDGGSSRGGRPSRPDRPDRPDDSRRSSRSRRRRRSSSQEAPAVVPTIAESTIAAIDHEYQPPKAVFVYTHVSRPTYQGMPDYRTEHFPRTGRTLEDFYVDISPLFDEEGNMLPPGTFRRVDEGVKEDTFNDGDWEEAED